MAYSSRLIECSFPHEHVLLLLLNRPPVNAYSDELSTELRHHFEHASRDPAYMDTLQRAVSAIQDCEKPVVAAVHGICFGAGLDLVSACDIRLCAENTTFSIKEVDIGLAADIGSLQRLPRVTGNASLLYELALTARNFGPKEAVELGLVSRVVPEGGAPGEKVREEALRLAKVIADKSPIATLSTKHLLNYSREHTVQEGLQYTQAWNMSMVQANDVAAAIQGFTMKKPPVFEPLTTKAKL
ncbi:hypothetical protein JCM8202v2_004098 [Rhodotorula sphaerocarpa]